MKRILSILLILAFVTSCSLLSFGKLTIEISQDYVDQIDEIIVNMISGDDVTTETITDIEEKITVEIENGTELIKVNAYNNAGALIFTGKGKPGTFGSLTIELDFVGTNLANHIIILQDALPWNSSAMTDMLEEHDFTEGTGENQYEFIESVDFDELELNANEDLVIIANDQTQAFYDGLADINNEINAFVYSGGTLFWEVCDNGWNYGDIGTAGIELPGGVNINLLYEYYNVIVQPDHPMFKNVDDTLYNNYASHEYMTNLAEGTNILMKGTDSDGATLITYPYGGGLVFMTGQPLEHAYTYGNTMGAILPRLVKLILGQEITGDEFPPAATKSARNSNE